MRSSPTPSSTTTRPKEVEETPPAPLPRTPPPTMHRKHPQPLLRRRPRPRARGCGASHPRGPLAPASMAGEAPPTSPTTTLSRRRQARRKRKIGRRPCRSSTKAWTTARCPLASSSGASAGSAPRSTSMSPRSGREGGLRTTKSRRSSRFGVDSPPNTARSSAHTMSTFKWGIDSFLLVSERFANSTRL